MNIHYIVDTLTSGETGKNAIINGNTWTLLKLVDGSIEPVGTTVTSLTLEEFKACLSLNAYDTTTTGVRFYTIQDEIFCVNLIRQYKSDTGTLSIADANSLLGTLGGVLQWLNTNSPLYAKIVLDGVTPTALFPQAVKDKYLSLLDAHLNKYPREQL